MNGKTSIILIVFLLVTVVISANIQAETQQIFDPEDDVLMMSELNQNSTTTTTDQRPNVDIVHLSYDHTDGTTEATAILEVNSRGEIEDRNDFEDVDINDTSFTGTMVTYAIYIETTENYYEIQYVNKNLTINYDTENANATVSDNELIITFNLTDANEEILNITATTIAFDILSLTDINYYFDIAPDETLFYVSATSSIPVAEIGEQITFSANIQDLLGTTMAPYTYTWDFDDGTTDTGQIINHTYLNPGSYQVQVTVEDANNETATATTQVEIFPQHYPYIFNEHPVDTSTNVNVPVSELTATIGDFNGDAINVHIRWRNDEGNWETLTTFSGINEDGNMIQLNDCVDINYIGRYASNNTIFDSSYSDPTNQTGGTPLRIYVSYNQHAVPPSGYNNYSAGIIEGLMTRLIGLNEGENESLGPIPPCEAYGEKLEVGDTFSTSSFALNTIKPSLSLNQTLEVISLTSTNLSLKWVNLTSFDHFTMPQIVLGDLQATNQSDMIIIPPPYFIWENASEIINIYDEHVTVKTTPFDSDDLFNSFEQIQFGFGENDVFATFPNATTFSFDDTSISLTADPEVGSTYEYSYSYFGQVIVMYFTVTNKTEDTIGLSIEMEGTNETQNQTVQRNLTFNRTYDLTRLYENIPSIYWESLLGSDLQRAGYSLHPLAGEDLIFDVTIEKIYKTSQYHTYSYYPTGNEFNKESTLYQWSINVTDGRNWTNRTYQFTTLSTALYTISGTIYYPGMEIGTIYIGVFDHVPGPDESPQYYTSISSTGDYSIQLPNGSYYFGAYMDVNDNGQFDDEPTGCAINETWWDTADSIEVNGANVTDVDITLSTTMYDVYTVTGTLFHNQTNADPYYVAAFDAATYQQPDTLPLTFTGLDGPGDYTMSLPNGSYYLLGFIDNNGNMEPDNGEAMGLAINKTLTQQPMFITVDGSEISGCDITLHEWYTISGTIYYQGSDNGTIHFGAENETLPSFGGTLSEPESYSLLVPEGRFIVGAAMDTNNNSYHDVGLEPLGAALNATNALDIDWIIVDEDKENIDITLHDTFSIPVVTVDDDFNPINTYAWGVTQFDTIQQAIDVVDENGTIIVHNGTYEENIVIQKPLTIQGECVSQVIIDGNQSGNTVFISSDNVIISNITITNGTGNYPNAGILVNQSYHTMITNCRILNNTCFGLHTIGSSNCVITNNQFSNNYLTYLEESTQNIIINNSFNQGEYLYVYGSTIEGFNHTLENNLINGEPLQYYYNIDNITFTHQNITQLIIANAKNISIEHCNFTEGIGIHFAFVDHSIIKDNHIQNNDHTSIMFHHSSWNTIQDNIIVENHRGMDLCLYNHHNIITNNMIAYNCDLGIAMSAYGSNNTISNNDINNNSKGIALVTNADQNLSDNVDNIIEYNHIHHHDETGICLIGSDRNIIRHNRIWENQECGINLSQSNQNQIYNNQFNNSLNAWDNDRNFWNQSKISGINIIGGPFLGGNHWSDYPGTDNNFDGLGDASYMIAGGNNTDCLPLINSTYDTQPPMINLNHPIDDVTIYNPLISINATAMDDHGVSLITISQIVSVQGLYLNDNEGDGGSGGSGGGGGAHPIPVIGINIDPPETNYTFNQSVSLYEGINTFTITAYDIAGNTGNQTLLIYYIPDYPPVIQNVGAAPSRCEQDGFINISYAVHDDFMMNQSKLIIQGPQNYNYTETNMGSGFFSYNHSYGTVGTYSYSVWAVDNRSHENMTETFYFWICENITITEINITGEQNISWQDTNVSVDFTNTTNITFVKHAENPHPEHTPTNALLNYIEIEIENDNQTVNWPLNITLFYDQDDLNDSNITEDQLLGLYYWNETLEQWILYNDTGVNTEYNQNGYQGYIWANVWHLTPIAGAGDSEPPSQVINLTVTDGNDGKLNLNWDAATDNIAIDFYQIYRDSALIDTTSSSSYTDTGLTNGQNYTYQIAAVDTSGNSGEKSTAKTGIPTESDDDPGGDDDAGGNDDGGFMPPGNTPPTADTTAGEPYTGFVNEPIQFDGSASIDTDGNITSWFWTFGDGTNATGKMVTHQYNNMGTYIVTLQVTDDQDATDSTQTEVIVTQPNNPPTTPMITGPVNGISNTLYSFSVQSSDADNDSIRYHIDWDDATINTTDYTMNNTIVSLTHLWNKSGVYVVEVYAEDDQNGVSPVNNKMVLIDVDVIFIKDTIDGYLLDNDQDGIYDLSHNNMTDVETDIQQQDDGSYLIDSDNDGTWDYTYDSTTGLAEYTEENKNESDDTPGFTILFIIIAIMLSNILYRRRKP